MLLVLAVIVNILWWIKINHNGGQMEGICILENKNLQIKIKLFWGVWNNIVVDNKIRLYVFLVTAHTEAGDYVYNNHKCKAYCKMSYCNAWFGMTGCFGTRIHSIL